MRRLLYGDSLPDPKETVAAGTDLPLYCLSTNVELETNCIQIDDTKILPGIYIVKTIEQKGSEGSVYILEFEQLEVIKIGTSLPIFEICKIIEQHAEKYSLLGVQKVHWVACRFHF